MLESMRRRLAVLVVATTSLVLVAFLVPLGYLVRQVAADRAVSAATHEAEQVAQVVARADRGSLRRVVDGVVQDGAEYPLTVFLPDGEQVGASASRSSAVARAARGSSLVAATGGGREVLVAVQGVDGGTAVVRVFVPDEALHDGVLRAWTILAVLGLALLGLGVLVADRLARALVQPLQDLAEVSRRLGAGDLEARVRPDGPPELRRVGRSVNHLAGRITELLAHEREGVADLSHRLRTPLTALRLDAEAVSDPEVAARLNEDMDALTRTVDEVIDEARRPVREGVRSGCDAANVVRERAAYWSALAEEEGRDMVADVPDDPVPIRVGEADLTAALDALLGNVFAHTPGGTPFAVRLRRAGEHEVTVTVADDGPGFGTRDPVSRGSSGRSTGLGLDIVRRTVEAAGGRLRTSTGGTDYRGATVVLSLGTASLDDLER